MIRAMTCPICEKELAPGAGTESRWAPFCSERCRNVDLYRWSEGRYAIVEPLAAPDETELDFIDDGEYAD